MTEHSRQPDSADLDWEDARRIFKAFVRHRLSAALDDVVEDLVQEALVRLHFMHLREPIRNLEAAANTIASSVVQDYLRWLKRRNAFLQRWALHVEGQVDPGALGDPMDRFYFVVIAYFERTHAPCAELARQFFAKVSWKTLAERTGRSYTGLRRLWSRCVERLRRALDDDSGPWGGWFDE